MRRVAIAAILASCGAPSQAPPRAPAPVVAPSPAPAPAPAAPADESTFGPLEVGADFASYRRVTEKPFLSRVHGDRWVDVYVNEVGADAYLGEKEIPVGTIIVKASWADGGGRPSNVPGPIFVMQKRRPGYAPEHGDWWYAIHWADPPPDQRARFGGPVYWRGASPRVEYCWDCHDDYDRGLGGLTPSSVLPR